MRKTTIYIDDKDFEMLKTSAFLHKCSMSELIRRGIKKVCTTDDPGLKQAMQSLNEIRENFEDYSEEELMDIIDEEIKEVRKNRKSSH